MKIKTNLKAGLEPARPESNPILEIVADILRDVLGGGGVKMPAPKRD